MTEESTLQNETDPRFPSGKWTGFYLQNAIPGRHKMELSITFRGSILEGDGRDRVGNFTIQGHYDIETGKCQWNKQYVGEHAVSYKGYNEGKGIWGNWEIAHVTDPTLGRGGFHIWPEGMPDPTAPTLEVEEDLPLLIGDLEVELEPSFAGPPGRKV